MQNKLVEYIQLINTENIGPITFYKLLDQFHNAENVIKNLPDKYKLFPRSKAVEQIDLAKLKKIEIISFEDERYPSRLREIPDAPPILYAKGNIELLSHEPCIAIVGARNASINGRKTISKFAYELTNNDILIISGMAKGIDTSAHKGAMHAKNQKGPTIAVVGTGLDIVYPTENKDLYEQISSQGLAISEFPIGTTPQSQNFPRRNRIISALSNGILVGEASVKSGSLITARMGLEQGKDIFAIPGNLDDFRGAGPNKLIKDGANLVEDVFDIVENLNISSTKKIKPLYTQKDIFINSLDNEKKIVNIQNQNNDCENTNILSLLTTSGVHIDDIIRDSKLSPAQVSMMLLELELDGKIEKRLGNIFALTKK